MENTKKQMMKMLKGYGEGLVRSVCEAYALNYEEVLKKVMGEEEEVKRGRPEKKAKRVVNKELVVEDVIMKGLMAEVAEEEKGVAEAEAVAEAVAEEAKPVKEKKKRAPKKKEAEAEGGSSEEEKPVKEKKKAAPKKKEAEAEGGSGEEEKPVKEKKKAAPKKKEAEAEGGSGEEEKPVKEKKKAAPKKKQAEAEGGSGEEEKPAEEPKTIGGFAVKSAEEMKPKVKDIAVKAASPAKEEVEEEVEEEETETEEIEYNGVAYLVTDDSVVFDAETREAVGTWDGTAVKFYTGDEE